MFRFILNNFSIINAQNFPLLSQFFLCFLSVDDEKGVGGKGEERERGGGGRGKERGKGEKGGRNKGKGEKRGRRGGLQCLVDWPFIRRSIHLLFDSNAIAIERHWIAPVPDAMTEKNSKTRHTIDFVNFCRMRQYSFSNLWSFKVLNFRIVEFLNFWIFEVSNFCIFAFLYFKSSLLSIGSTFVFFFSFFLELNFLQFIGRVLSWILILSSYQFFIY